MPGPLTSSPSAERNKGPILEVLRGLLPATGAVLETASGTGQHVIHFAAAFPGLVWQPSELDATRRAVIAARVADAGLPNVRAPVALDVLEERWPVEPAQDAVLAINLIHIAPWPVAAALIAGAARLLRESRAGLLVLYGPYKEGGQHTAPSNAAFDQKLRADDPDWGVRNLEDVSALAAAQGFGPPLVTRMPANNLTVAYRLERFER
jgi:hypothetical protein